MAAEAAVEVEVEVEVTSEEMQASRQSARIFVHCRRLLEMTAAIALHCSLTS